MRPSDETDPLTEPVAVPSDGYLPGTAWNGWHVLALLGGGFFGSIIGAVVANASGRDVVSDPVSVFGFVFPGQVVGSLAVAWYLSRDRGTSNWVRDFGFRLRPRHAWGLLAGVGLQVAALLVTGITITVLGSGSSPDQEVVEVAEDATGGALVLALVATVLLAPLVEELIYRAILLSRLRRSMGRHRAVFLSGGLFAIVHLVDPGTLLLQPALLLIGVALGYAALRSGDLSLPLFVHAGVNLTGFLLAQFADDLQRWAEDVEESVEVVFRLFG